ncbi:unnamed protein product [Leuciscus chuanchicus]
MAHDQAKLASKLRLEKGAIPTIRDLPEIETASTSHAVSGTSTVVASNVRDVGCQTEPVMLASTGTQLLFKTLQPHFRSEGTLGTFVAPEADDSTYNPEDSVNVLTESMDTLEDTSPFPEQSSAIPKMRKLLVFEECLLELFEKCPVCTQVCEVFKAMQLQMHSYRQFRIHCRNFIEPAVLHKWKNDQAAVLQQLSTDGSAILGGDMRADSPGHSAKFGSYTMMDLNKNTVIDIQLVQSNEVGGSVNMEKEGLKRSLAVITESGIKLDCIVSDRLPQIQKFLTDAKITQYYDVWHFEKGMGKKLKAISKTKDCEKVKKWLPMIKNQIYWIAASSTSGPERIAKWSSVINHLQDIHNHDDPLYPVCRHASRVSTDKEKWLKAGTPVHYKLEKLFTSKRVLKDVSKLSPHHQTSSLEAFHSVVIRFVPKSVPFPFLGMLCRLYLSAMHYNENAVRPQRQADGKPSFKLYWPKGRKGTCTVKPLKEHPTFNYVDELMHLVFDVVFPDPEPFVSQLKQIPVPDPLCSQFEAPAKEDVVARYMSRFNRAGP